MELGKGKADGQLWKTKLLNSDLGGTILSKGSSSPGARARRRIALRMRNHRGSGCPTSQCRSPWLAAAFFPVLLPGAEHERHP